MKVLLLFLISFQFYSFSGPAKKIVSLNSSSGFLDSGKFQDTVDIIIFLSEEGSTFDPHCKSVTLNAASSALRDVDGEIEELQPLKHGSTFNSNELKSLRAQSSENIVEELNILTNGAVLYERIVEGVVHEQTSLVEIKYNDLEKTFKGVFLSILDGVQRRFEIILDAEALNSDVMVPMFTKKVEQEKGRKRTLSLDNKVEYGSGVEMSEEVPMLNLRTTRLQNARVITGCGA